jgi:SEFIR domain.
MDSTKEYKVFISYSWTTETHEEWVYNLATRLMEDGIEVKLDKWDLTPGDDKYAFMESMVQDQTIDKVLIVCDRGYKEKADSRKAGVGTETQIITPEIYGKANQNKYIPIIVEKGENFDSYTPTYLKSRIGIDMSREEVYEEGYDELLRLIAERPLYRKPVKGQLPSYLFEDEKSHFKTKNIVKQLKNIIVSRPDQANYLISDFIDEFKNSLNQFQISDDELKDPYDEQIYSNIKDMEGLRNDYIDFLTSICKANLNFEIDVIINLFEDIYSYTEIQGSETYNRLQFDHYKFFITELFLYTVVILIENSMFKEFNILTSTKYFIKSNKGYNDGVDFTIFKFHVESLDVYRKQRLNNNRTSIMADLLVERSVINNKNYKEKLLEVDLLLHYISMIKFKDGFSYWFPTTYIYLEYHCKVDLLRRLVSKRHFEKVKIIFNVDTKDEMKLIIENLKRPTNGYSRSYSNIPGIANYINPDEVCTSV